MPPAIAQPSAAPSSAPLDADHRERILHHARALVFAYGYSAFTMADLARELGISKKTLYVHFAGKDEIVREVLLQLSREIRADADRLMGDRHLNFAEKLRGFVEGMMTRLSALNPSTMRDLQRFAPALFRLMEELRQKNIPYIFGRLVEEGQLTGMVRTDIEAGFAIEFFLQAMQGLLSPATLERLKVPPPEILNRAIRLFFGGLLTSTGRKEYEKLFPV
jgi:AcrR family transcriptional regulator